MPSVGLVVLTWNGRDDTLACLKSLEQVHYPGLIITVVDNGSTDDTVQLVRERTWRMPVEVIETGRNLGYAGGNNVGLRRMLDLGRDYVLLLNNDTVVSEGFLSQLVDEAEQHPEVAVVGPWILYADRRHVISFAGARWDDTSLRFRWPGEDLPVDEGLGLTGDTDYVCGAAMLFRSESLRRVGFLDERFFLVYEESDWCFRARRAGLACRVVPGARIWHKVGASFGSEQSPLRAYFSSRNQLLWARNHLRRGQVGMLLIKAALRQLPRFYLGSVEASYPKRLWWSATEWVRSARRMWREPVRRADRLGVIDFLLGRFGDCPEIVRSLSQEWVSGQCDGASRGVALVAKGARNGS